jgi:biotin transport system substrate-specific component
MNQSNSGILIDQLSGERSARLDLLCIVGFSLLTALSAQLEIHLPFTPVPVTGQTFMVLLSGAVLGSRRGFASQALYLAEGAAGMPVFAGGAFSVACLFGPTGGYLWSYPIAAGLLGWLVERGAARRVSSLAASLVFCDALILLFGTAWLRTEFGMSFRQAVLLGIYPFLVGDALKITLVGLSLPKLLGRLNRSNRL